MGLVDYSDSESDNETPAAAPAPAPAPSKKPFQKLAHTGKILVNLPTAAADDSATGPDDSGRPAKRAKTGGGGGRFSGFSSFLPPPKPAAVKAAPTSSKPAPRPGVHLNFKTSAEAAFSRDSDESDGVSNGVSGSISVLNLPPPKAPSIPEGQKPAEAVKLVGKPLMFKPLSVARKPGKKGKTGLAKVAAAPTMQKAKVVATETAPKKKVSLFSLGDDEPTPEVSTATKGAYQPVFAGAAEEDDTQADDVTGPYDASLSYSYSSTATLPQSSSNQPESLETIADDLNLSAAARRELFGRNGGDGGGGKTAVSKVINFNMDQEYAHNEALRASGETVQHNPVRAIMPGKHSLRQLVNAVQNQREALEENFAKNRANQKEAAGRYGWR